MRVILDIATASIALVSLAACQSTVTQGEQKPATPGVPQAMIEASGFGGSGDYLWVTATVRDVPVGQFATVSFDLYGSGALLATESRTEQSLWVTRILSARPPRPCLPIRRGNSFKGHASV